MGIIPRLRRGITTFYSFVPPVVDLLTIRQKYDIIKKTYQTYSENVIVQINVRLVLKIKHSKLTDINVII